MDSTTTTTTDPGELLLQMRLQMLLYSLLFHLPPTKEFSIMPMPSMVVVEVETEETYECLSTH